ncbi:kelch domain-containing protein 7A [Cavia porcellus]|uniref:kelch domain-containing protein 7A n=1 Tax=Cavia porcellus TaxID=10141 RepID=UPI00022B5674|nr:kelch domain-containing protein 7A [Cavia porcellus]
MLPRGAEAQDWHLDMQLMGKVVLSAVVLFLVTAAYRLYKSRPARALQKGGNIETRSEKEAEGSSQPVQSASPGTLQRRPKRKRASHGAGAPRGCSWEDPGGPCVLDPGATCRDGKPSSKGGQCSGSEQESLCCCGQEAGTAVGGKPTPPCNSSAGLAAAVDSSCGGGKRIAWPDGRPPEQPEPEELGPTEGWVAPTEGSGDMNQNWIFSRVTEINREEPRMLQAASELGLAMQQQEGATNAFYTFSSMAWVRMEENFIQKAERSGLQLKGKVYDYYVESTSRATSRLASRTAMLAEPPSPGPVLEPLGTGTSSGDKAGDTENGDKATASPQPEMSPSAHAVSRKKSLLQIAENPELQLQPEGFREPAAAQPAQNILPGPSECSGEPHIELVARTNFFHIPLSPASSLDICLDLGNCYEVLTWAKKQDLQALKEAVYKLMSDNYLQVLRSPDIYGCLSGAERELILRQRLLGRKCLVVADMCPQEDCGRLCCYDDEQDAWYPLAQLPPEAVTRGCAVCSLFNYLFVVSGCQGPGHQPSNRVFCYNPLTGIWSEVSSLNQARPHCQLVALDGYLYAIGGECLNTVERYDPRLDHWTFAPPLPSDTFALAHTATVCADEIFVTGGSLRYLLLRFSVQGQRWRASPTGGSKDRTAEMVAVNGFLYRFDLNRSLGISVYRCSAGTLLWYECATWRTPYPDAFLCAVVDTRIYCVGRRRTLCFLADHISPRFVPKELQHFPSPRGTLLPTVLTLPGPHVPQTRV